jgi:hypothetical protein
VFPSTKLTVPVGAAVPEAGFTVAVITVDAVCGIVEGAAAAVVVVETSAVVVVTVTAFDVDPVKMDAPE